MVARRGRGGRVPDLVAILPGDLRTGGVRHDGRRRLDLVGDPCAQESNANAARVLIKAIQ